MKVDRYSLTTCTCRGRLVGFTVDNHDKIIEVSIDGWSVGVFQTVQSAVDAAVDRIRVRMQLRRAPRISTRTITKVANLLQQS